MRKRIIEATKLRTGRRPKTSKPYPWVKVGGKYFRVEPYYEHKCDRLLRMFRNLKDNEFIWLKGRIPYDYKCRYKREGGVEFYPWYQEGDSGFLAFRKGQVGKILDGKVSLGKAGRVQEVLGLPDFSRPVSGRTGSHGSGKHGSG